MTNLPVRSLGATALLLGLMLGPARAADWPLLRGDAQRTGVSAERLAPPLSLLWRFTGAPQRNNPAAPAIVGNTVYFATGDTRSGGGVVYALDVRTGAQKWRYPSQGGLGGGIFLTAPLVDRGSVYIGASDGNLYMINAANGELVRSFKTGGSINSSPLIYNDVLYFGSNDNTLYAVDPQTGQPVWRQMYRAQDNINSAPIIAGSLLYVSSADQHVHAVNVATGIGKWRFRLPFASVPNGLVFADNTLYVPSGARLHAFQPQGNLRWAVNLPADISVSPVAEGGIVYIVSRDRKMYALRSNNGREAWERPVELPYDAAAAPTISGDILYVPTIRNVLYALSREDGKILWDYSIMPTQSGPATPVLPYTALSAPLAISNGTLYALSDDGSVSAFRPDAPDSTPPLVGRRFPQPGSLVSGAPPLTFAVTGLNDPGSGLDRTSVRLTLTGPDGNTRDLDTTFDVSRALVHYQTKAQSGLVNPPLPNGRHTVTLTASDWRGNQREESWSFVVDNTLPATVNREQAAPAAPRTPGQTRQPAPRPGAGRPPAPPGTRPGFGRPGTRPGGPGGPGGPGDRQRGRDRGRGGPGAPL